MPRLSDKRLGRQECCPGFFGFGCTVAVTAIFSKARKKVCRKGRSSCFHERNPFSPTAMPLQLKLRLKTEDDVPFLKSLWHAAFGWTEEISECFIEQAFHDSYCIISENYKKPRAALCLITGYYSGKKAFSVYAAATEAKYRGMGIMSRTTEMIMQWCEENKCALIAKTNAKDAERFFSHRGMRPALFYDYIATRESRQTREGTKMIVRDIDDDEYIAARHEYAAEGKMVEYNDAFMRFLLMKFRRDGGRVIRISYGYSRFCATAMFPAKGLVLTEALASHEAVKLVLPFLQYRFRTVLAAAFLPTSEYSDTRHAGLIK